MVHVYALRPPDKIAPFFYTVSQPVGKGHTHPPQEDAALVRFMLRNLYTARAMSPAAPACMDLQPFGGVDQKLIDAITAVQRCNFPASVDGYVSPQRDDRPRMIMLLNAVTRKRLWPWWPNLWDYPQLYPPILKDAFRNAAMGNTDDIMPLK